MARRVSLPRADDLFRPTAPGAAEAGKSVRAVPDSAHGDEESTDPATGPRRPSGRVRHDEKMTVYVTSDELLDIEHTRLSLRRAHGLAVDRGRLVREAISLILADFEEHGDNSALVQRLTEQ
ncbi:hypothetical protein [Nocardioides sp. LHG3406-4]|uniref:hypothetical protein n=1 Tax=Nocardioides sp. LHG3406-4 TaxID=2804575 RepID=UPI003CF8C30B